MKSKLLTLAGGLALVAVLGKFYAVPVLAQVRAALVQDRDAPARQPYLAAPNFGPFILDPSGAFLAFAGAQPSVPAGKRRVITGVSALINGGGACTITISWGSGATTGFQTSLYPGNENQSIGGITGLQIVQDAGPSIVAVSAVCPLQTKVGGTTLTGYDIDIP